MLELREILQDGGGGRAREEPLEDPLHRELARAAARRDSHPAIALRVLAISTATRAASAPFTDARAVAWASFSVVSTPFATGIPVSSCTSRMPRALSVATTSKWKVSPRTTQPRATSVS